MKRLFCFVLMVITLLSVFTGCRKDKTESELAEFGLIKDNSLAESSYDDALTMTDGALSGVQNFKSAGIILSSCATVTIDVIMDPHLLIIDFGTTNCLCNDQKERRGKILVSFTGAYRDSGTVINISFDDYFVNDNKVLGTKTVTNKGTNIDGNLWYSILVNGSIVKAETGDTITWQSARTRTWIEGEGTTVWSDDVYLISGSANGESSSGEEYQVLITNNLRREIGCHHFVSGELLITRTNKPDINVDFGNGDCDDQVTITINGVTYNYVI